MEPLNILVIDNGAANIKALVDANIPHNVTLVTLGDFQVESVNNFNVVEISGSVHNAVVKKPEVYSKEIDILWNKNVPIVGICMGFEVIAYAYGAKFLHLKERIKGLSKISALTDNPIFSRKTEFLAAENHKWAIQEVSESLEVLAKSDSGIEIIKHKGKPIYGMQFHPESTIKGNESRFILDNILKEIADQKRVK